MTEVSPVSICNLALTQIGDSNLISSLTDDSEPARVCNAVYEQDRNEVLERYGWPFARTRVRPAKLDKTTLMLGEVPGGFDYAFARPANMVWLERLFTGQSRPREDQFAPFAIEYDTALKTDIVLCHVESPEFVYISSDVDTNLYPAHFVRTLAWRIAADLVLGLRKDAKLGESALIAYERSLLSARDVAMRSVRLELEPTPRHIAER